MANQVYYFFEEIAAFDTPQNFTLWLDIVSRETHKDFVLNYIFCSEEYLLNINQQYLNHDYYTDIITFDLSDPDKENFIEADIFISLDTVLSNSKKEKDSFANELARVMSHGVFHLLGYNDKTEEEKTTMRQLEDEAIAKII